MYFQLCCELIEGKDLGPSPTLPLFSKHVETGIATVVKLFACFPHECFSLSLSPDHR